MSSGIFIPPVQVIDLTSDNEEEGNHPPMKHEYPRDSANLQRKKMPKDGDLGYNHYERFGAILKQGEKDKDRVLAYSYKCKTPLTQATFVRVLGVRRWLDDEAINAWGEVVIATANARLSPGKLPFIWLNSFYWVILESGFADAEMQRKTNLQKITRPFDTAVDPLILNRQLLETDTVFMPINTGGNHWALCTIRTATRTVTFWDSLEKASPKAESQEFLNRIPVIRWWLHRIMAQGYEWRFSKNKGPQQDDTYSCGIITCMNILSISLGLWPSVGSLEVAKRRQQIAAVLLSGDRITPELGWGIV